MKKRTFEKEKNSGTSRRSVLKAATVAAIGMMLDPLSEAQAVRTPVDYGRKSTQTQLNSTTLFPLLTGWLLLTTSGPASSTDLATIQSVANLSKDSAQALLDKYQANQQSFSDVRQAFSDLAKSFATVPPYSGGQCPDQPKTIAPIAALPCGGPAPAKAHKSGQ
jgi:hypothetical protein